MIIKTNAKESQIKKNQKKKKQKQTNKSTVLVT